MKKIFVAVLLLLVVGAISFGVGIVGNPFKVTDPSDPKFNPNKFQFEDYHTQAELINVFRILFPVGTPKEFVERILVTAGGAEVQQDKTHLDLWHYWVRLPFLSRGPNSHIQHLIIYDDNLRVLNIEPYAANWLYADQLNLEDLERAHVINLKKEEINDR